MKNFFYKICFCLIYFLCSSFSLIFSYNTLWKIITAESKGIDKNFWVFYNWIFLQHHFIWEGMGSWDSHFFSFFLNTNFWTMIKISQKISYHYVKGNPSPLFTENSTHIFSLLILPFNHEISNNLILLSKMYGWMIFVRFGNIIFVMGCS